MSRPTVVADAPVAGAVCIQPGADVGRHSLSIGLERLGREAHLVVGTELQTRRDRRTEHELGDAGAAEAARCVGHDGAAHRLADQHDVVEVEGIEDGDHVGCHGVEVVAAGRLVRPLPAVATLGAVLGVTAGLIPAWAVINAHGSIPFTVPWQQVGLVVLGVPVLAAAATGVLTRSRLPSERRAT